MSYHSNSIKVFSWQSTNTKTLKLANLIINNVIQLKLVKYDSCYNQLLPSKFQFSCKIIYYSSFIYSTLVSLFFFYLFIGIYPWLLSFTTYEYLAIIKFSFENKLAFHSLCIDQKLTISQDVQTWFSEQLAFAKFLSKINGNY